MNKFEKFVEWHDEVVEFMRCPLCGGDISEILEGENFGGEKIKQAWCGDCRRTFRFIIYGRELDVVVYGPRKEEAEYRISCTEPENFIKKERDNE